MNLIKSLPLSETKLRILLEIYAEGEDYLRNIEKKTKINPSLLFRNLKNLEEAKIIEKSRKANGIFYSLANETNLFLIPILEKYYLSKIIEKHREIKTLVTLLQNNKDIMHISNKVYIFGSFVVGEVSKKSDIDILFISKEKKEIVRFCREASTIIGRDINPLVYTPKQFKTELKNKEPLLTSIVTKIKNRVIVK